MYVAVQRYEGVRDSQKVAQLVDEDFIPHKSTEGEGVAALYSPKCVEGVFSEVSLQDPV